MRKIYLDNSASTPVDRKVTVEMVKTAKDFYANPSSFNDLGRQANKVLNQSRLRVARFLGAHSDEVIFTSSGSAANSLALLGLAQKNKNKKEIILSRIEHKSVLASAFYLESLGYKINWLEVDREGRVNPEDVKGKINKNTLFVSVMYANNEVGTIQPIIKIGKIIKDSRQENRANFPVFHVDACQATDFLNMNADSLGADLLVFNGSKIYGPKGIAVLYKRRGVELEPQIRGGDQEYGLVAGTENLPSITGLARALDLVNKNNALKISKLRDYLLSKLKSIPDLIINGPLGQDRLSNNINFSIKGIDSEMLLAKLDQYGIYGGSGSACTSRSVEPSHVLVAMKTEPEYLNGSIRLSLGRQTKKSDLDFVYSSLEKIIDQLK